LLRASGFAVETFNSAAGFLLQFAAVGIRLRLVEARPSVCDILRSEGFDDKLGGINRFTSVADAVDDFQNDPARTKRETP